jgi:hypothetical protein
MIDERKDAGLRAGDPASDAAASHPQDEPALGAARRQDKRRAALNPQIRNRLATQLREMYDTVVQQPVPDRFAELIAKLDAGERKGS